MFDKIGVKTGVDFFDIADAAEEVVAPAMPAECLLAPGNANSLAIKKTNSSTSPSKSNCEKDSSSASTSEIGGERELPPPSAPSAGLLPGFGTTVWLWDSPSEWRNCRPFLWQRAIIAVQGLGICRPVSQPTLRQYC